MCSKILTENTNVDKQLLNFTGIRSFYAKAVSFANPLKWAEFTDKCEKWAPVDKLWYQVYYMAA